MKKTIVFGMMLSACVTLAASAEAGIIVPSAVISDTPDGANFDYSITLTNAGVAGDDPIGTFWFSWIPGQDYMATRPISESTPSGWKAVVTHDTSGSDGYAIQWEATSTASAIAPGGSLTFGFTSADTPAMIMGNSLFFQNPPVLTSFVYSGLPFATGSDPKQFTVMPASVPEPSSLVLGVFATAGALVFYRRRRRTKV